MESKLTKINQELLNGEKVGDEAVGDVTDERGLIAQGEIVVDQVDESIS